MLSNEEREIRRGKPSASEIHKLLTGGKRPMTDVERAEAKANKSKRKTVDTMFGDTALTYISEKAYELEFGIDMDDELDSFDIRRGNDLEPLAFQKHKELMAYEFIDVVEGFWVSWGKNSGCTPDGMVGTDAVLEIKCPRAKKFFGLVKNGYDSIDKEYIAQMQMQMMITNSKRCHFFNYIIYNGEPMHHEIIIDRDENMIDDIKNRIEQAVIIRDEYVEQLRTNKQF